MLFKVVGIQEYDFTGKDGKQIAYGKLCLVDLTKYEHLNGHLVSTINVSKTKLDNLIDNELNLDSTINVDYNSTGKVVDVSVVG